jgi:hypothetical protein
MRSVLSPRGGEGLSMNKVRAGGFLLSIVGLPGWGVVRAVHNQDFEGAGVYGFMLVVLLMLLGSAIREEWEKPTWF